MTYPVFMILITAMVIFASVMESKESKSFEINKNKKKGK